MSTVHFGEDTLEVTGHALVEGFFRDDLDGQSLCGWAWDRGAEHQQALDDERGAWVSTVVRVAVEREREACAKTAEERFRWSVSYRLDALARDAAAKDIATAIRARGQPCPRCAGRGDPEHEGSCGECGR